VNNKVLVVSNPEDEHTRTVCHLLDEYEVQPILFYPEELSSSCRIELSYEDTKLDPTFVLQTPEGWHHPEEFLSVWYRRPRPVTLASHNLDAQAIDFARDEWSTLLRNFYDFLPTARWVSHPRVLERASNKIMQLALARQLGLSIPDTLITSDPIAAREFIDRHCGQVIVKPTGKGWIYDAQGEAVTYVLANRLRADDIDTLDDVVLAPITLQQEISKAFELRVNIVGQKCLAIKIDSQKSEISQVDWRRYDVANTPYSPFELPDDVANRCLLVCKELGLEFGAIDLICQPDGGFVFLEVNGNGQFLWAEELSGVRVSMQLACLLAGVSPVLAEFVV